MGRGQRKTITSLVLETVLLLMQLRIYNFFMATTDHSSLYQPMEITVNQSYFFGYMPPLGHVLLIPTELLMLLVTNRKHIS